MVNVRLDPDAVVVDARTAIPGVNEQGQTDFHDFLCTDDRFRTLSIDHPDVVYKRTKNQLLMKWPGLVRVEFPLTEAQKSVIPNGELSGDSLTLAKGLFRSGEVSQEEKKKRIST